MKLYNFFRSGTSHRLRIALNLKGLVGLQVDRRVILDQTRVDRVLVPGREFHGLRR